MLLRLSSPTVKLTMRYTHIGIEDQATAVARLPWNPWRALLTARLK